MKIQVEHLTQTGKKYLEELLKPIPMLTVMHELFVHLLWVSNDYSKINHYILYTFKQNSSLQSLNIINNGNCPLNEAIL